MGARTEDRIDVTVSSSADETNEQKKKLEMETMKGLTASGRAPTLHR